MSRQFGRNKYIIINIAAAIQSDHRHYVEVNRMNLQNQFSLKNLSKKERSNYE